MAKQSRRDVLVQLLSQSWREYDRTRRYEFVVCPAIPILFFGDSERYFRSPLKVITVGLNPSAVEFPDDAPFRRFPAAQRPSDRRQIDVHLKALNNYFSEDPYEPWFDSFEPILNGLDASYYSARRNTALHTDLCSPLATSPTWSELNPEQRLLLQKPGGELWHSLVTALRPDVIIVSVAAKHLTRIGFRRVANERIIWTLDDAGRKQPYNVFGSRIQVSPRRRSVLAFGRAAQTPFGTVSRDEKGKMGRAIRSWYRASSR